MQSQAKSDEHVSHYYHTYLLDRTTYPVVFFTKCVTLVWRGGSTYPVVDNRFGLLHNVAMRKIGIEEFSFYMMDCI